MRLQAAVLLLHLLPALAWAADTPVPDLDRRLRMEGVEPVNARLLTQAATLARLHQAAGDCEPEAVELTVKLGRTRNTRARDLHQEALRVAVGACTEFVLSLLAPAEVPKVCASASAWTVTQTARELRRRIAQIDVDERLRPLPNGQACRAAYVHELHHTRVGLRVATPARPPR